MSISFSLALPRDPVASSLARRAVSEHLADVVPPDTVADVTLAVSELVANAVLHGIGEIELRVEADASGVKDGVADVGGRGLHIVGQLAESWGVHEGTTHVWFQIPAGGAGRLNEDPDLGHPGDHMLPDV
jgi:hypothetical protein